MDHILTFIGVHPLLTGSFVAVLVLFVVNETQRGGKTIGAQALVDWVNQRNALVLDVRDRKAFSTGHIAQSLNIPFATLEKIFGRARESSRPTAGAGVSARPAGGGSGHGVAQAQV